MMAQSKENLKFKVQQFQNKSLSEFMVKWKHYPKKQVIWEIEKIIQTNF